jgi:hypothetical protein
MLSPVAVEGQCQSTELLRAAALRSSMPLAYGVAPGAHSRRFAKAPLTLAQRGINEIQRRFRSISIPVIAVNLEVAPRNVQAG